MQYSARIWVVFLVAACGPGDRDPALTPDAGFETGECANSSDVDQDGIPDVQEGCALQRDTDGDGTPDFEDLDSDGDEVPDGFEDRNGDGKVGTCITECSPTVACMTGFMCSTRPGNETGICIGWTCANGETDPLIGDTDNDGVGDAGEGTWVCNPVTDSNPNGYKEFKKVDSAVVIGDTSPNWKIAIEKESVTSKVTFGSPGPLDSAYFFDLTDFQQEVGGFVVSRSAAELEKSAVSASQRAIGALASNPVNPEVATLTIRSTGKRATSLDGFDTVLSTTLVVSATNARSVPAMRKVVVQALLGVDPATITFPDAAWTGSVTNQFAVTFQTLYREESREVIFMGAVSSLHDFDDQNKKTPFHMADLSGGTGLTQSGNPEALECAQFEVHKIPKADIMWVVDESGSMDDDRANISNNANAFFEQASSAGLDFRMGVTDMDDGNGGMFASRTSDIPYDGRWLINTPSDQNTFSANINDPSGPGVGDFGTEHGLTQAMHVVERHLPRDDNDPQKVRTDAKLVLVIVTDESPDEIEEIGLLEPGYPPTATQLVEIANFVLPWINLFTENDMIVHAVAVPTSTPDCSSLGEGAWGYSDVVTSMGGQFGSICQSNLGPTVDVIIDDIIGSASPIVLQWVPISLTITVSRDGEHIPRSLAKGFDYRASSNSIIFNNMPFDPAAPAELVISYRRWQEQIILE